MALLNFDQRLGLLLFLYKAIERLSVEANLVSRPRGLPVGADVLVFLLALVHQEDSYSV